MVSNSHLVPVCKLPWWVGVNVYLLCRYFLVQKAKEAKTVGILVGTLGAGKHATSLRFILCIVYCFSQISTKADYLVIIERLKTIMRQAGKKVCIPVTASCAVDDSVTSYLSLFRRCGSLIVYLEFTCLEMFQNCLILYLSVTVLL